MKRSRLFTILAAGAVTLVACGGDDSSSRDAPVSDAPAATTEAPAAPADDGYGYSEPLPATAPPVPAAATPVQVTDSPLGQILADAGGLTVYGFTQDTDGNPTCNEACADAWPPVVVDGDALPDGLDPNVFSLVERDDGSQQLKAGTWPLYRFAGDAGPGETNGQGSGDVWFVVAPDGTLVQN